MLRFFLSCLIVIPIITLARYVESVIQWDAFNVGWIGGCICMMFLSIFNTFMDIRNQKG